MNPKAVYTKTSKGMMEVAGKISSGLPRDVSRALSLVDGKLTVADIQARINLPAPKLNEMLTALERQGFIREFVVEDSSGLTLDFTSVSSRPAATRPVAPPPAKSAAAEDAKARAEAEAAKKRAEQEALARIQAEARARAETEAKLKAEAEAARMKAAAIAKAKAELEAKAKAEAETQARIEAEARAKTEAEAKIKAEAEAKAQAAAEAQARAEAEAAKKRAEQESQARAVAEAARLQAEQEAASLKAEAEAAKRKAEEAEARANAEAEARLRAEAEAKARDDAAIEASARAEMEAARLQAEQEALARAAAEAEAARLRSEAQARAEAERKTQAETEARFKTEAEARARAEEESARLRAEAAARAQEEAEAARKRAEEDARARDEAQAKAREIAAAKAEADAELARLRAEAEAARAAAEQAVKAREAAEAKASAESAAREHAEGSARAKLEAEASLRAEAEARRKAEAAEQARAAAEQRAQQLEAEDIRARAEAEARAIAAAKNRPAETAPRLRKEPVKWVKPVLAGLTGLLFLAVALVHFIPFTAYIPAFEKAAADSLREPVSIGELHVALLPTPHFTLQNVAVGTIQDIKAASVTITPELGSLSAPTKVLKKIEIDSVAVEQAALARIAHWLQPENGSAPLQLEQVVLQNVKIAATGAKLPTFDATLTLTANGDLRMADLRTSDGKISLQLSGTGGGEHEVSFTARNWTPPIEPALAFDELEAKGTLAPGKFALTSVAGRLYGGILNGTVNATWNDTDISASSDFDLKRIAITRDIPLLSREILASGELQLSLRAHAQAKEIGKLFDNPRLEGNFTLKKGTLTNIDLVRALQSPVKQGVHGGQTRFTELSGTLLVAGKHTQFRQVKLNSGLLSANGAVEIAPNKTLSGHISVELGSPAKTSAVRGYLGITGPLSDPALYPANRIGPAN